MSEQLSEWCTGSDKGNATHASLQEGLRRTSCVYSYMATVYTLRCRRDSTVLLCTGSDNGNAVQTTLQEGLYSARGAVVQKRVTLYTLGGKRIYARMSEQLSELCTGSVRGRLYTSVCKTKLNSRDGLRCVLCERKLFIS